MILPMQKTIQIDRLGIYGEGVGRLDDGRTLFVDGALPGEIVEVRLYEEHARYARAEIVKILSVSPQRQKAPCPYFGKCGGCQLMHLDYLKQLEMKQQKVADALIRIGKLNVEVLPCIPSPLELGYRNKIQLPALPGDPMRLGLYAQSSHDLVEIDRCMIHCHLGDYVFQKVQEILKASNVDIKHLLIKTSISTHQALVILVTSEKKPLFSIAEQILNAVPEVKGVVQNINPSTSNRVLGTTFHTLAGSDSIEEKLSGLSFKVSAASFFQVNPLQAEKLYEKAVEYADLKGDEVVLDAYCGVGTLSLILAKKAKEVIGIECVEEAIQNAKENSLKNQIFNATFICAKAENVALKPIDVVVVNPPRKGCEASFLEAVIALKPKKMVYISCDPATLARDLALLCAKGFQVEFVQPFDMFPQTAHVETIVKLKKTKENSKNA